jgi:hypothetical protein
LVAIVTNAPEGSTVADPKAEVLIHAVQLALPHLTDLVLLTLAEPHPERWVANLTAPVTVAVHAIPEPPLVPKV